VQLKTLAIGIFMVCNYLSFYLDHRLYKQSLPDTSKDEKSIETWTLIADSSSEWTIFTQSLKGSRNRNDKNLYSYLSGVLDNVIPFLEVFIII
jgi:hypothetical protein